MWTKEYIKFEYTFFVVCSLYPLTNGQRVQMCGSVRGQGNSFLLLQIHYIKYFLLAGYI